MMRHKKVRHVWKRSFVVLCALALTCMASVSLAWDRVPASGAAPAGYAGGWYQDAAQTGGSPGQTYISMGATTAGSGVTQTIASLNSNSILRMSGVNSTTYSAAVANDDYVFATFSANVTWAPNGYRIFGYRHKPNQFTGTQQTDGARLQVAIYNGNTKVADIGPEQVTRGASTYITVSGTSPVLDPGMTYQIRFYVYSSNGSVVEIDNMELLLEARQVVTLRKTWVNAAVGNTATVTPTGTTPTTAFVSTANTASETDASTDYDINTGASFNVSELVAGATYTQALACSVVRAGGATASVMPPYTVLANDRHLTCAYTNARAVLVVVKNVVNDNGGTAAVTSFGITTSMGALTFGPGNTTGNTTTYTSNPIYTTTAGNYTLAENDVANYAEGTWACSGNGVTMGNTAYNAGSVTLTASATATCTITNNDSNVADLSIIKTRTPTGPLAVGQSVDYTLTVTNNGPATATGAVITDTPQSGLSCPVGNTVNCAGPGCPAATTTVGALIAGWALGTLSSGQSVSLTFRCAAQ